MSNERITVTKVNEKLIRLSSKVGLEPDITTKTGNGILGKVEELFKKTSHNKTLLESLEKQEEDRLHKKDLITILNEIETLKKNFNKTLKIYIALGVSFIPAMEFLGDKPLEILKFLFSHGIFP